MFTPNAIITEAVDKIFDYAKSLKRGDALELTTIERLTGVERYAQSWNGIVQRLKNRMLRERGIELRSERELGYKLQTPSEQVRDEYRQRRAARQLTKNIKAVEAVTASELSPHMRRFQALKLRSLKASRSTIRRGIREQQAELRKIESMPKRAKVKAEIVHHEHEMAPA